MFHPWQQTGFAAHRLSPDLPVSKQVEQSSRAEEYFDFNVFANMSEFGEILKFPAIDRKVRYVAHNGRSARDASPRK